jgi:peptidoglycan lytic transglycosylase
VQKYIGLTTKRVDMIQKLQGVVYMAILLIIAGCASPKPKQVKSKPSPSQVEQSKQVSSRYSSRDIKNQKRKRVKNYKVGAPYRIKGVWYYPCEDFDYQAVGIASWYGRQFHNRKTANGERFNMNTMTAAHRTLPMPCMVEVTNLDNGKNAIFRVNDRGPYVPGSNRIIDLSKEGAKRLGFLNKGTQKVRVRILKEQSMRMAGLTPDQRQYAPIPSQPVIQLAQAQKKEYITPPKKIQVFETPNVENGYFVQAGAFSNYENASKLTEKLGVYGPTSIFTALVNGKNFFRVRMGPWTSSERATEILKQVVSNGHQEAKIVSTI